MLRLKHLGLAHPASAVASMSTDRKSVRQYDVVCGVHIRKVLAVNTGSPETQAFVSVNGLSLSKAYHL